MCITWCYGPGGYIVNNTGGLAGTPWYTQRPDRVLGARLARRRRRGRIAFEVYLHEEISDTSAGMFYKWDVRSVGTATRATWPTGAVAGRLGS